MVMLASRPLEKYKDLYDLFGGNDYHVSEKIDGVRVIVRDNIAYTRAGKVIRNRHMQDFFTKISGKYEGFILDGEFKLGDLHNTSAVVNSYDRDISGFKYYLFDVISNFEMDFHSRNKILKFSEPPSDCIIHHDSTLMSAKYAKIFYDQIIKEGGEGIIIRSNKPYKSGRSPRSVENFTMLKIVGSKIGTGTIISINEGYTKENVKSNTLGSITVKSDGEIFNIGSGFTDELKNKIYKNKSDYLNKTVVFKYHCCTNGLPRHCVFKYIKD